MNQATKLRYGFSIGVLMLILILAAYFDAQPKQDQSLCTGKPDGNVVILIDHSESITQTTHQAIQDRVISFVSDDTKIKANNRISVFLMTDDFDNVKPVFEFCKPITGGNPLVSNPLVQQSFYNLFERKLKQKVSSQIIGSSSSPIIEMLSTIGRTKYFETDRKQLYVFSDLLEYSKYSVDLYKRCSTTYNPSANGFEAFREFLGKAKTFSPLQLPKDAKVELHQIPRPELKNIQQSCIVSFWQDAFGNSTPSFYPLP